MSLGGGTYICPVHMVPLVNLESSFHRISIQYENSNWLERLRSGQNVTDSALYNQHTVMQTDLATNTNKINKIYHSSKHQVTTVIQWLRAWFSPWTHALLSSSFIPHLPSSISHLTSVIFRKDHLFHCNLGVHALSLSSVCALL